MKILEAHDTTKHFPAVVVLLSTFNGERYLEVLLNSLLSQDYPNFSVITRDDGSVDQTNEIIRKFIQNYPSLIRCSNGIVGNLGVAKSYLTLLESVPHGSYVMFCDQDDLWFDWKISAFVSRMQEIEYNNAIPALVFGDMIVTDKQLVTISHSFWTYQCLDISVVNDWRKLLVSNVVSGCSCMLNYSAALALRNAPVLPILHDHLAAIIVARDGIIADLRDPTMLYRQHDNNTEGARSFSVFYLLSRLKHFTIFIVPRYLVLCNKLDVPMTIAMYMKITSTFRRIWKRI